MYSSLRSSTNNFLTTDNTNIIAIDHRGYRQLAISGIIAIRNRGYHRLLLAPITFFYHFNDIPVISLRDINRSLPTLEFLTHSSKVLVIKHRGIHRLLLTPKHLILTALSSSSDPEVSTESWHRLVISDVITF